MHNDTSNYSSRDEDHCNRYQLSPIGEHSNKHFPVNYRGFLFTVIIVNCLSFPFTVFLDAMVLMAVIRNPPLQTNPNILLTCLSVTDLLVGMISQPLHVSIALLLLLGDRSHKFCHLTLVFNASVQILCGASLFHLVLISAERYFTIKKANSCTASFPGRKVKISKGETGLTTIIAAVAVSYTTPWIITVIARLLFAKEIIDVLMAVREVGLLPLLLNSVINPIIYTVKKQPFRIAVIELLSEKSFQEAQAFDGRLFGSKASGIVKTTRSEKTNESDKLEHNSNNNDNNSIR